MSMPMPQGRRPFVTDESAMGKKFDDVCIRLTNRPRLLFRAAVSDAGMVRFFQLTVDAVILLCAKIHEFSPLFCASYPRGGLSSSSIANYTHTRPLFGHCAPPLHKKANRPAPFGLDLLDFHSKSSPIDQAKINFLQMLDNLLFEEYIMLHRGYNLTNHDTNFQDTCSAVKQSGRTCFHRRF